MPTHPRVIARRVTKVVRLAAAALALAALLAVAHMEFQDARAREIGASAYLD